MIDLYLSDIELDFLEEKLSGTSNSLEDALFNLKISIDPDRALALLQLDNFGACERCGQWDEGMDFSLNLCWDCLVKEECF